MYALEYSQQRSGIEVKAARGTEKDIERVRRMPPISVIRRDTGKGLARQDMTAIASQLSSVNQSFIPFLNGHKLKSKVPSPAMFTVSQH